MGKYLVATQKKIETGWPVRLEYTNYLVSFEGDLPTEKEIRSLIENTDECIVFMQKLAQ